MPEIPLPEVAGFQVFACGRIWVLPTPRGRGDSRRNLDRFLEYYNVSRSHQGYRLKGRTPAQAMEALIITELPKFTEDEPRPDVAPSNEAV